MRAGPRGDRRANNHCRRPGRSRSGFRLEIDRAGSTTATTVPATSTPVNVPRTTAMAATPKQLLRKYGCKEQEYYATGTCAATGSLTRSALCRWWTAAGPPSRPGDATFQNSLPRDPGRSKHPSYWPEHAGMQPRLRRLRCDYRLGLSRGVRKLAAYQSDRVEEL